MQAQKRRIGDRWDGRWLRDLDSMHVIMPHLMPHRADNEAFIRVQVDLTNVIAYLERKNQGLDKADRYTFFHVIASSLVKTVTLRPKLNRFIQGTRLYQRDKLSLSFVVKKQFADEAHESLAFLNFDENTTVDSLHEKLLAEIRTCRKEGNKDSTEDAMAFLSKVPRPLLRLIFFILRRLDFYGKVPRALIKSDPNYAAVFITNLGSIKMDSAYHHLNNWGTNSLFVVIGKMYEDHVMGEDGVIRTIPMLEMGITLDERIADGYYYSRSVQILKKLLENPELLEKPANEEVEV